MHASLRLVSQGERWSWANFTCIRAPSAHACRQPKPCRAPCTCLLHQLPLYNAICTVPAASQSASSLQQPARRTKGLRGRHAQRLAGARKRAAIRRRRAAGGVLQRMHGQPNRHRRPWPTIARLSAPVLCAQARELRGCTRQAARAEQAKEAKGHRMHFAALASQHVGGERTVAVAAAAATRRLTNAAPGAGAGARTLLIIQALAAQKGQINAAAGAARRCASGPCSRAGR